jgi:hypothetical protein
MPPANSGQFPPGVSGNPGGRPAGRSLTARLRESLELLELEGVDLGKKSVADALVAAMIREALAGDVAMLKVLLDRLDGKLTFTPPDVTRPLAEILAEARAAADGYTPEEGPTS